MSNFPTSGQVKSEGVQYGMILYNRDLRDYFHKGQTVLAGTELPFQDVQKRYVGKRVAKVINVTKFLVTVEHPSEEFHSGVWNESFDRWAYETGLIKTIN